MAKKRNYLLLPFLALCVAAGCAESSKESAPADTCVNGAQRCVNNNVEACENGAYAVKENCSEQCIQSGDKAHCSGNTVTTCTEGDVKCDKNNVVVCESNSWNVKVPCEATQTCNATKQTCDEQVTIICNEGATRCVNNTPRTCKNNAWEDGTPCSENEVCNGEAGKCDPVKCTPGAASCDGNTLKYCDQNAQDKTEICEGGTVCDADQVRCVDPAAGQCEVSGKTIADGKSLCMNGSLVSCSDGETETVGCDDGEVCHDGDVACAGYRSCSLNGAEIAHGSSTCNADKDVVTCNDGVLSVTKDCTGNQVCVNESGAYNCKEAAVNSCELNGTTIAPNAKICDKNKLRTCTDGALDAGETCPVGTSKCENGGCVAAPCGAIANGQKSCNEDNSQIATCRDGSLVDDDTCTEDEKCSLDGATPSCVPLKNIPTYETIKSIHNDYSTIVPAECDGKNGNTIEANVDIEGVVTGKYIDSGATKGIFIQDASIADGKNAGIFVFCNSGKTNCPAYDVSLGDNVKVVADGVGHLNCQLQIRSKTKTTITKTSKTNKIVPVNVNVQDVNSGVHGDYNGTLVKLSHVYAVEKITTPKGWYVADDDGKRVLVSNKLSKIQDLLHADGEYYVTGIVEYNTKIAQVMPRVATDVDEIECTGTQTKCGLNADDAYATYTCSGIKWSNEQLCPSNVDHGVPACNGNACGFECESGYHKEGSSCVKDPEPKKDCKDANNKTVTHGKVGCNTKTSTATCDDGNWTGAVNCSVPANSIASCSDAVCDFTCEAGFTKSGSKCIENGCKDNTGATVSPGEVGCKHAKQYAVCSKGAWGEGTACEIENGESKCRDGECYAYSCNAGFEKSGDGKSCVSTDTSCSGENGVSVASGEIGCKTSTIMAMCENTVWDLDDDCATKYDHGTGKCSINSCVLVSCETGYAKNSDSTACVKQENSCTDAYGATVRHNADGCNTTTSLATCNNGSWATSDAIACASFFGDHVESAECQNADCVLISCADGYVLNASNNGCDKVNANCTDYEGSLVLHNEFGCKESNVSAGCVDGNWDMELSETCDYGCDVSTGECRTDAPVDVAINACVFQAVDEDSTKMAYGRVFMNGKTQDDYDGRLVCISEADNTIMITVPAVFNQIYNGVNAEFMASIDLVKAESGMFKCTFEFRDKTSSTWYACGANTEGDWWPPIKVEGNNEASWNDDWYRWIEGDGIVVVVDPPEKYTKFGNGTTSNPGYTSAASNTFKTHDVKNADGAINIGPWPTATSADFSTNYVRLTLTADQIALLAGKTTLVTTFDYKISDASKSPRHMAAAFFNGDTMVGSATVFDTSTSKQTAEFETAIDNPTSLQLRIVGYDSVSATAGTLYIYPIGIIAQ